MEDEERQKKLEAGKAKVRRKTDFVLLAQLYGQCCEVVT